MIIIKILYEVGKGGRAFLFSGSGSIISFDYMIFFRLYLSIVRIRLSIVGIRLSIVSFDRRDYTCSIVGITPAPTPSNSLFAPLPHVLQVLDLSLRSHGQSNKNGKDEEN